MSARRRALALFWVLLAAAVLIGVSTTVHNGATFLALLFLAAAMAVGIRIAVVDEHTQTNANTTALAEGATR